jgi:8-oxo-dGTP pyrophosphatase MutT (NUDIX family)
VDDESADAFAPVAGWDDDPKLVRAAGGAIWRRRGDTIEILLVHRPRYDDWSLPKGKLDADESHLAGALREVEEETGYVAVPGKELVCTRYHDGKGRKKTVRYWEMTVADGSFAANHETDEIRWLPADEARRLLSYAHDEQVVDSLATHLAK